MKHLLNIEQWMNRETAFILLIVLFVGVIIGAKVMYELAKSMFYNQQPPYFGPYQQGYPQGMHQQLPHARRNGSLAGMILVLFLLGVLLLLLGQSLLSKTNGTPTGQNLQEPMLPGQVPKNIEVAPEPISPVSTRAIERIPDFVGEVDEPAFVPRNSRNSEEDSETEGYIIRTGVFSKEAAAQQVADELLTLDVPAGYYLTQLHGASAYATFIGLYQSEDIAKFALHELKLKNAVVLPAKGLDLQWQ